MNNMISANDALKLTKLCDECFSRDYNLSQIINACHTGKTSCDIMLGTLLTEEELKSTVDEYINKGYNIISQWTCSSVGGWREPEKEIPTEYWAIISWDNVIKEEE